jgi:hypothetical protein
MECKKITDDPVPRPMSNSQRTHKLKALESSSKDSLQLHSILEQDSALLYVIIVCLSTVHHLFNEYLLV